MTIRKRLFVGSLGFILVVGSMIPFFMSDAANAPQQDDVSKKYQLPSSEFPYDDIRLAGKGEFMDEDLLMNPGFEAGTTPWIISGQVTRSTSFFPHTGVAYMIVNGVNGTSGTLYQPVTIPTGPARNLTFWLNITTSEATGAAMDDRLFIEVLNTSGRLLATLTTFSNRNSGTVEVYVLRGPYNLSAFAGQTVRIQFRGTNDITLPTSFRVDDVSVQ